MKSSNETNPMKKIQNSISVYVKKYFRHTDLEDISYRFDLIRLFVSHLEVSLPYKPLVANNIRDNIKDTQYQLRKEYLFVQYDNQNYITPA